MATLPSDIALAIRLSPLLFAGELTISGPAELLLAPHELARVTFPDVSALYRWVTLLVFRLYERPAVRA